MLPLALKGPGVAPAGNDISGSGLTFGIGADGSSPLALSGPGSYGWENIGPYTGGVFNGNSGASPSASAGGTSAGYGGTPSSGSGAAATNLPGMTVNGGTQSMMGATNLPAINVSAMPSISAPTGLLSSMIAPAMPSAPISATNLSPVHVTAPRPGFFGWMADLAQNHPFIYQGGMAAANALTGGALTLPEMVVNGYVNHMNGGSFLGSFIPSGISAAFDGIGSALHGLGGQSGAPSTPAQATNALLPTMLQNGSGNPGDTSFTGGSGGILTGAPLPDYAGLSALGGGFGNAPMGGYWNQQALHMANPTYGPYAGIGSQSAPQAGPTISPISGMTQPKPLGSPMPFAPFGQPHPINDNNPYAPSGITTAGY